MRILLFSAALLLAASLNSQSIKRSVISSGGGSATGSSMFMSMTMGESATIFLSNAGTQLDQGFQQASMPGTTTNVEESKTEAHTLKVYPNPVKQHINFSQDLQHASVSITNLDGKILIQEKNSAIRKMDVSNLPSGVYVITIRTKEETLIDKFIKE